MTGFLHAARLPYVPRGLRVGLLLGSFNPAHWGHLALSLYALRRLRLQQIWWVVSPQNPLKSTTDMADLATRIASAKQVVRSHPRIRVIAPEAAWGTQYTVDFVKALRHMRPQGAYVLLLGDDNWRQLPRWRAWRRIVAALPIAVFRRATYAFDLKRVRAGSVLAAGRRGMDWARRFLRQPPPVWLACANPIWPISATMLRKQQREQNQNQNKA